MKTASVLFAIVMAVLTDANAQIRSADTKLLCSASVGGQKLFRVLMLDYVASTVDARKAVITDNVITWATVEKSFYEKDRVNIVRHELNRLAGTYSSYAEGVMLAGPPTTFFCEKAPPAKF